MGEVAEEEEVMTGQNGEAGESGSPDNAGNAEATEAAETDEATEAALDAGTETQAEPDTQADADADPDADQPPPRKGPDYLNMSDEELLNAPAPDADGGQDADAADSRAAEEAVSPGGTASKRRPSEGKGKGKSNKGDDGDGDSVTSADADTAVDYEAEYKRLLAPFRANGHKIELRSVDDAISLMQMGANYNKKMSALKPNLKLMKMLEKAELLDEKKLSFLIDLDKKNPEAVNKLVSDAGIDPFDLSAEKASEYKQSAYAVDDKEMALDTVLDELQESVHYNRTLEVVGNKWDAASRTVVYENPELLRVIHNHIESGVYDLIQSELENEAVFGRLNAKSDLDAYRKVGDALQERGAFDHLEKAGPHGTPATAAKQNTRATGKDPEKLRQKKRAASSTRQKGSSPAGADFNPLALSDDEFSKAFNEQFQ